VCRDHVLLGVCVKVFVLFGWHNVQTVSLARRTLLSTPGVLEILWNGAIYSHCIQQQSNIVNLGTSNLGIFIVNRSLSYIFKSIVHISDLLRLVH